MSGRIRRVGTFTTSNELSKNLKRPVSVDLDASEEPSNKKFIRDGKFNSELHVLWYLQNHRGKSAMIKMREKS
ncbi:hypothetical protein BGX26_009816 [Mortierella sp. AD094]|nr:hypothetical protein BGX26_009816 [Mortierella sp. AD094]